jgi:glyoxylase-like metal-dependent hydrolase (beta-lactamase superfamily II)
VAEFAADLGSSLAAEDAYRDELLVRHGATPGRRDAYWRTQTLRRACWSGSVRVDAVLGEGDLLDAAGRTLRVALRPGHSPTDTVFFDDTARLALAGDHLLPDVPATPILTRPPEAVSSGAPTLQTYLDSLRRSAADDIDRWYPGHGDVVSDHRALIRAREAAVRRKLDRLAALLDDRPATAVALADTIWPHVDASRTYVILSEVVGVLELLSVEGRARAVEDAPVRWRAA